MTIVELSSHDAELFRKFMEHYDKFSFLVSSGAFDIKRGSATINFSRDGDILSIDRHLYTYSPKSDKY